MRAQDHVLCPLGCSPVLGFTWFGEGLGRVRVCEALVLETSTTSFPSPPPTPLDWVSPLEAVIPASLGAGCTVAPPGTLDTDSECLLEPRSQEAQGTQRTAGRRPEMCTLSLPAECQGMLAVPGSSQCTSRKFSEALGEKPSSLHGEPSGGISNVSQPGLRRVLCQQRPGPIQGAHSFCFHLPLTPPLALQTGAPPESCAEEVHLQMLMRTGSGTRHTAARELVCGNSAPVSA